MRILFDAQQLTGDLTGVGYYTDRILARMLAQDRQHEWALLCHRGNAAQVDRMRAQCPRASIVVLDKPAFGHFRMQHDMLRALVPQHRIDVFFSPSFLSAPRDVCASISVVHDATYALYPEFYGRVADYLHDCVTDSCAHARRIITMSQNSRDDLVSLYRCAPSSVAVIPLAADEAFRAPADREAISDCRGRHRLPERYVLAVNMGSKKKNAQTLFKAFAAIEAGDRQDIGLAVVGEWHADASDLNQMATDAGIRDRVVLTGYVPIEDLRLLYAGADVFCFPSYHEGFGLPVAEAMASGVPVVASRAGSIPEVAGDAAILLDPGDVDGFAAAIAGLLGSATARAEAGARGRRRADTFSWERTADATLRVIEETCSDIRRPMSVASAPRFDAIPSSDLVCVITVDDVRPEPGFGGRRLDDPLGYLQRLYDEFGCRSTLFVPTNWKGEWPVEEHQDWLRWLLDQKAWEVACHGHLHAIDPGHADPREFLGITPDRLEGILDESFRVFANQGHRPVGVKAPGWALEPSAYAVFERRFSYVADHVQGASAERLTGGKLVRFPYHSTIDSVVPWPDRGLVVLQSHIAPEGRTTNGWTEDLYHRMRSFLRTGRRLGARFSTLQELSGELARIPAELKGSVHVEPPASVIMPTADERLRGGTIHRIGESAGVLYHGASEACPLRLRPEDATVVILSRNRRGYLVDLLASIDRTGPAALDRVVILNNSEDDSADYLARHFPHWRVVTCRDQDHPEVPAGLRWLQEHARELLPRPAELLGPRHGWTTPRGISWLRNQQLEACQRPFLVSFDDDFVVEPGWWEYYETFQHTFAAHAVFNNFGAFVMANTVWKRVGPFDERFLGSHGYEDLDYAARIAESKMRWVLGFNVDHDWRSAEQGNKRGSMTGCDRFIHRYALMSGGFSARRDDGMSDPIRAEWNGRWWKAKWNETVEDTGIIARPPFKGTFLRRRIAEESAWPQVLPPMRPSTSSAPVKMKENTPVDEIDPVSNPVTGTMIDRYAYASHWCKGKRVIDAACGYGYGSVMLLALGAESVLGLDLDADGLAWATQRYTGPRVSFARYDLIQGGPCAGAPADVVVSIETMEHLPREGCESYLRTLRGLVRPNGTALITTPRRTSPVWQYRGGTHRYEYSPEEFRALIGDTFPGSSFCFKGIDEFRVQEEPRLYSRWTDEITDRTRIMVAIVEAIR